MDEHTRKRTLTDMEKYHTQIEQGRPENFLVGYQTFLTVLLRVREYIEESEEEEDKDGVFPEELFQRFYRTIKGDMSEDKCIIEAFGHKFSFTINLFVMVHENRPDVISDEIFRTERLRVMSSNVINAGEWEGILLTLLQELDLIVPRLEKWVYENVGEGYGVS